MGVNRYLILCLSSLMAISQISFAASVQESQVVHRPGEFIKEIQNDPNAGQKVYEEFCASCHAVKPSIEVNAPRKGVRKDWEPYLTHDLNTLLKWADEGVGNMPPRGGCFECSDQNLKDAIHYMLPEPEAVQ
jgi:cytochrome c5